jgi:hypothetical protein
MSVRTDSVASGARLQIELSPQKLTQLEELMESTGLATKKDLINNALTLLTWAVRETKNGRMIVSLDGESKQYKEILLPALENQGS